MPGPAQQWRAVFWDFGGVILSSPFEAFQHYERDHGLPDGFIRSVNATDPDHNAWAHLERSQFSPTEFDVAFADESTRLGHRVPGADVLALLGGEIRPRMVAALDAVRGAGYRMACLTNNVLTSRPQRPELRAVLDRFDAIIESSKVGVRKPEPRFYELACAALDVRPEECIFLDDLGINLKPAKAMGMATIKVTSAEQACTELGALLDLEL